MSAECQKGQISSFTQYLNKGCLKKKNTPKDETEVIRVQSTVLFLFEYSTVAVYTA